MPSKADSRVDVHELLKAGAHFGHKTSRWHPNMKRYIHSQRGKIHIIDLMQTAEKLEEAADFARSVAAEGKQIVFVGTKKHVREVIESAAKEAGMPYVANRWLGGMLTNFGTIGKRIKHLKELEEKMSSGELKSSFSKREVGEYATEVEKLNRAFAGVKDLSRLPGALFVADLHDEAIAVNEANRLDIPVIGIVDTNADPEKARYPIPANDDAKATVSYISNFVAAAIKEGKAKAKPAPPTGQAGAEEEVKKGKRDA